MVRDRVCIASFCIGSDSCQFFISQFRGTMISLFMAMVFSRYLGAHCYTWYHDTGSFGWRILLGTSRGLVRRCCQFHNCHKHLETLFLYRYGFKMSVGIYWKMYCCIYVCLFFLGFDRWYSFIIGSAKTRGRLFRVELVCFGFFVIISVDFDNSIL